FSRFLTGIEIHPAAIIGRRFFIDHGMGVVIGETCDIGNDVIIYQGVTLGGTGHEKGKRHPTVKDNVLIATGAKVLGAITISENSHIGGRSGVSKNVPPNTTVGRTPSRVTKEECKRIKQQEKLDHHLMPETIPDRLDNMQVEIDELKAELNMKGDE